MLSLVQLLRYQGDWARLTMLLEEQLARSRQARDQQGMMQAWYLLGFAKANQGEYGPGARAA